MGHLGVGLGTVLIPCVFRRSQELGPLTFATCLVAGYLLLLYRMGPEQLWPREHGYRNSHPLPAIHGSSMLFAMYHTSWPNPIPLFFLGLGLGWLLAYRPQSLLSPVVVHTLFSGVAFLVIVREATWF
jgi:hypothetical protein